MQYLLLLLADEPMRYIVIGSHTTVSACTLPPWLPAQIVDSMNQFFGGKLQEELVKLMRPTLTRSRSTSTGSRRISSDSAEGVSGMDCPPIYRTSILRISAALSGIRSSAQ